MSTTDRIVGDLVAVKQRRLAQLLGRRGEIATAWTERISHALPGVEELTTELLLVELAIAEQWPANVETWMREWIVADASKLHDPANPRLDCSLCVTVSEASGAA